MIGCFPCLKCDSVSTVSVTFGFFCRQANFSVNMFFVAFIALLL